MANEMSLTLTGRLVNGDFKDSIDPGIVRVTQAAIGGHFPVVVVGSSAAEAIATGDVSTLGWCYMRNLDGTNWVSWGPKTSTGGLLKMGRIEAGEWAAFRLNPGSSFMALASTTGASSVKVQVKVYED